MKVAIVTGATRGIGRACAQAFADDGWGIVAVGRDPVRLEQLDAELGNRVRTISGDVSNAAVNEHAVKVANGWAAGLHAVVANAGMTLAKPIDETTEEDFDRIVSVNLRALVYLAQQSRRALAANRGSFVVMASNKGLVAQRHSPLYVATKGAAVQLARSLALDWAEDGVRVNAVCPGLVDTSMLASFVDSLPDPHAARRQLVLAQPLGRLATPAECAAATLFLASERASFISGVALPVDGGFTAQ
jgi:meso-butanediol dehydrogenase / (S,S)-butanediol dehydrogenase / diacetyl reductase